MSPCSECRKTKGIEKVKKNQAGLFTMNEQMMNTETNVLISTNTETRSEGCNDMLLGQHCSDYMMDEKQHVQYDEKALVCHIYQAAYCRACIMHNT